MTKCTCAVSWAKPNNLIGPHTPECELTQEARRQAEELRESDSAVLWKTEFLRLFENLGRQKPTGF